jgi:hypothetical protein
MIQTLAEDSDAAEETAGVIGGGEDSVLEERTGDVVGTAICK